MSVDFSALKQVMRKQQGALLLKRIYTQPVSVGWNGTDISDITYDSGYQDIPFSGVFGASNWYIFNFLTGHEEDYGAVTVDLSIKHLAWIQPVKISCLVTLTKYQRTSETEGTTEVTTTTIEGTTHTRSYLSLGTATMPAQVYIDTNQYTIYTMTGEYTFTIPDRT